MSAKTELADFVDNHLSRNPGGMTTMALASVVTGLASILTAYGDAQERRGNWGAMLANLKQGVAGIKPALNTLRAAGPAYAAVVAMADRELQFAALMQDEIVRLQAGETTGV
jgi:hypothetical protein